jgi:phosphoribosylformimino-5-aminoimidazole carboxamide ribotide isomerase
MLLFPAIDLKDGKCVRLLRGDMAKATVFNDSPAAQAKAFANAGCEWLHLVDLNGAVEGHPVNRAAVEGILKAVKVPAQLGGGIRTIESIAQWIEAGVQRVILGTVAVKEPGLVKAACKQWPNQIAVGIDARDGIVAVDGWTKQSTVRALDLALRFEDAGVAAIIYTDIDRDGAMGGVNVDATVTLAQHLTTPVIASGGVSSLDDLRELRPAEEFGIVGAIVGRALYDGRVTVPDAIRVLKGE